MAVVLLLRNNNVNGEWTETVVHVWAAVNTLSMKTWDWCYCVAFVFGTLVNKASVLHSATTMYPGCGVRVCAHSSRSCVYVSSLRLCPLCVHVIIRVPYFVNFLFHMQYVLTVKDFAFPTVFQR